MELVSENAVQRWSNDMNEINVHLCEKFDRSVSMSNKYFYGSENIDDALRVNYIINISTNYNCSTSHLKL